MDASCCSAEPSRKRPRLDRPEESATSSSELLVRDEKYYFSDGSCVLQVGNTLFNVHRSIMSMDGSTFSEMFSMPQNTDYPLEGTSDATAIKLSGDLPSEFRNFLWALYSLPRELTIIYTPDADLTRLVDIAHISNKYSFKSTETWALDVIQDYIHRKSSPISPYPTPSDTNIDYDSILPRSQLTRLVRLAQICNHAKLLDTLITLIRKIMTASSEWAYLALELADSLDLKALRGAAYLEVMQKERVVLRRTDPEMVAGSFDDKGRLVVTKTQQLRLLSGYYRLTGTWETLRSLPPHFEHATGCGATWHKFGCTQSWQEFWRDKTKCDVVLALGLADVIGRLRMITKEFDRWGTVPHMHPECRMAARRSIMDQIKLIEDQLPDFFVNGDE